MRHPDVRYAAAARAWGLRTVKRLTWGIAGAGAVGAVILMAGFSGRAHQAQAGQPQPGQAPVGSQNGVPGSQLPGSGLQPPPLNPGPALGPGQVVSGGS
jgi:hypothetical protein